MPGPLYLSASRATVALDSATGAELWRVDTPLYGLAVAGPHLYSLASGGWLHALRPADGAPIWRCAEPLADYAVPADAPDAVYAITAAHAVVALRAADGAPAWRRPLERWHAARILGVSDGQLFIQSLDEDEPSPGGGPRPQAIRALDARDGAEQWRHAWREQSLGRDACDPALDADTLYACTNQDTVVALARADGAMRWTFPLSAPVDVVRLLASGMLAVGSTSQVFALATRDASVRWRYRAARDGIEFVYAGTPVYWPWDHIVPVSEIVSDGERVLVALDYASARDKHVGESRAGALVALGAEDGALRWRVNAEAGMRPLVAPGSAAIGALPTDHRGAFVAALAASDGHETWRRAAGTAWRRGEIIYAAGDGALTALAAGDGTPLWSYPLGGLDPYLATSHPSYADVSLAFG